MDFFLQHTPSFHSLSAPLACAAMLAALAAWIGLHWLRARSWPMRLILLPLRLICGFLAVRLMLAAAGHYIVFDSPWNLSLLGFLAVVGVELVVALYGLEQRNMPLWLGRAVVVMRGCAVLMLALVFTEPTFSWAIRHSDERFLAVLLDDSASLDRVDSQAPLSEQFALAEQINGRPFANRLRADKAAAALRGVARRVRDQSAWLAPLAQPAATKELPAWVASQRAALAEAVTAAAAQLAAIRRDFQSASAQPQLPKESLQAVKEVSGLIDARVQPALADLKRLAAGGSQDFAQGAKSASAAVAALAESVAKLEPLQPAIDAAEMKSLTKEDRDRVLKVAASSRRALAAESLAAGTAAAPSLLAELRKRYTVKCYRFAGSAKPTTFENWKQEEAAAGQSSSKQANSKPDRETTNIAAALHSAKTDLHVDQLAGIVVVSDGCHNASEAVEPIGQWLGARQIPVCGILAGSTAVERDAAIRQVSVPDTLQLGDQLVVRADIRADGAQGETLELLLKQDGKQLDRRELLVPEDRHTAHVEFTATPKSLGLQKYEVSITPLKGERVLENNVRNVAVQVVDDPVRLLLIDDRPRWEFRYLRNLFAERDKTVRLQSVLLHPDHIEGAPPRGVTPASAADKAPKATALPAAAADWSLFDVVILGDVSPQQFDARQIAALRDFVERRGGTLVVISGRDHMPSQFAGASLSDMLPLKVAAGAAAAPSESAYRLALAPEGEGHLIMQLDPHREVNRLLWSQMPEMHLRFPSASARPAAQVLAYAEPIGAAAAESPAANATDAEEQARRHEKFIRDNALIAVQNFGAGRVCELTFDSTWRFRYLNGDTYHHRFWGQVLRWAAANKLPHGNERVRLGTDRAVYAPRETPLVRVSLRDEKLAPLATQAVSVVLHRGDAQLAVRKLTAVDGEPGMYQARLDPIPQAGTYRVSLTADSSAPRGLADALRNVSAEYVSEVPVSLENAETAADPAVLNRLAEQTGGGVAPLWDARQLLSRLGQPSREIVETKSYPLWNRWPWFLLMISLFTTEWALRKKAGLT